ncbi:tRNA preQ1(34) S-adenosylmethionine ribosyltransferase-isomerase QueA [Spirulina sp. CS-785/01]|uniref:tRNA preQ1(34) S-adenosylmethionine ribosyltransferase-isomerase QueA n=1 Tax=Spirulina sp. CS-785/01 TaxID=3021716 RepID=UPI00232E7D63|nr:tRNA preQ1(34) S-adenosylmethionine ribosyltransferase-isomerase QueA [Spirulina sp. CS-785/01]MDB9314103.1 tRNA preQ1(34) S-adenosylmethionine ribosyltransferase-isomerase QueA [Spirulina sp. CS-785/01]
MTSTDRLLSSYQYELPKELIAQTPVVPRDHSRLLVVESPTTHSHHHFYDLPNWLRPGDLLVLNNSRVLPARLYGRKSTGAPVEILMLREQSENCWLCLVKPGKRFKIGTQVLFTPPNVPESEADVGLWAKVIARDEQTGGRYLEFQVPSGESLMELVAQVGEIPFPPYVTDSEASPDQYQTVYAEVDGSAAAPTAGLHFTEDLLATLTAQGITQSQLTLHVGVGTFRPVESEDISQHTMHDEWFSINSKTVQQIQETKAAGGRVIAVGTTVARALEGAAQQQNGQLTQPFTGSTNLFIYPGYEWQVVDGMITNFHLPGSSLLIMISALVGRERLLALYQEAIAEQYRFYSFGDAMLILPDAVQTESATEAEARP